MASTSESRPGNSFICTCFKRLTEPMRALAAQEPRSHKPTNGITSKMYQHRAIPRRQFHSVHYPDHENTIVCPTYLCRRLLRSQTGKSKREASASTYARE